MNSKRPFSLVLCLLLSFSCIAFADETAAVSKDIKTAVSVTESVADASEKGTSGSETEDQDITELYADSADELYVYGLFKGGADGFDLKGLSTKAQAAVMVVRLIGAEEEALSGSYSHPYSDVPSWASAYVGYLYDKGITIADDTDKFGSSENIDLNDFLVLVIQALGYDDIDISSEEGRVTAFAKEIDILSDEELDRIAEADFCRGTMAYVARKALDTDVADTEDSLYEILDTQGLIQELPAPDDSVKNGKKKAAPPAAPAQSEADKAKRDSIIATAKDYIGVGYRSGGKTPSGFDCSGFVGYVMMENGVWDSHPGSCVGIASISEKISMDQAKPGDVVLFSGTYRTNKAYTHVGIYLGDGMMIHCSSSRGVTIDSFTSGYWANHYSCIARPNALM